MILEHLDILRTLLSIAATTQLTLKLGIASTCKICYFCIVAFVSQTVVYLCERNKQIEVLDIEEGIT
jgi:hypothetical protein